MGFTPYMFGAIAALMLTNVLAQIPQVGLCPSNVKAMDNFELEKVSDQGLLPKKA